MDGSDFIAFASKLSTQNFGAPGYRSASSRAYYGAYHLAITYVRQFGWFCLGDQKNEHIWVQRHFLNCQTPEIKAVGKMLENLHVSRKEADYDLLRATAESKASAEINSERAEEVRSKLTGFQKSPMLAKVRSEMEAYRKKTNQA